jgi:hypothetical protein
MLGTMLELAVTAISRFLDSEPQCGMLEFRRVSSDALELLKGSAILI